MSTIEQRKQRVTAGIFGMLATWTISVLALETAILLAYVVNKMWLPFFLIGIYLIKNYLLHTSYLPVPRSNRVASAVGTALVLSAIVMVAIIWIGDSWEPSWIKPQPRNSAIPYISILIVAPMMAMTTFWQRWCRPSFAAREKYRVKIGTYAERDFLEQLYMQESSLQLETLFGISALVGVADWFYYFKYYINVNINSPDTFFFVIVPSVLLAVSWVYFLHRYRGMWVHYCHNEELDNKSGFYTEVRFLIVGGDHLYLTPQSPFMPADTPVKCRLPITTDYDDHKAYTQFVSLAGVKPVKIRFAYSNENMLTLSNVLHYICFFDDEEQLHDIKTPGEFYSIEEVWRMVRNGDASPVLESELRRIYTVAVTWKTYSPTGSRLYAIRNYRPTFRLRDLHKWEVDYNDKNWLAVAAVNQDKPFWHLRRFWRKLFGGI
ncbi:MAG: hypothetical protein K2K76_10245 [Muribaculaceae bacterium]|nr:hypothetical protein [Muribaculaceae bacterium]